MILLQDMITIYVCSYKICMKTKSPGTYVPGLFNNKYKNYCVIIERDITIFCISDVPS